MKITGFRERGKKTIVANFDLQVKTTDGHNLRINDMILMKNPADGSVFPRFPARGIKTKGGKMVYRSLVEIPDEGWQKFEGELLQHLDDYLNLEVLEDGTRLGEEGGE